ncbi:RNA polymerase sigma factor [Micromonospora sp. NPDC000442]|uniref:RNA polymerase sigma factor n=1 Tax=Micromonospora sp. NPDC000442 TaxID=3364217 RepID=UPI003675FCE6
MQHDVAHQLRLAASGDQDAWNNLVDRFSPLLWSICRHFGLSSADAADAFQLTWLRLLEHLDTIHDPARLPGWLGTTCRRECLGILRRNKRVRPTDDDRLLDRFSGPSSSADQPALIADRNARLWREFGRLDVRCQKILRLLLIEPAGDRVSYELVAAALDMPVGSLGPIRGRCLARLRGLLDAEGISDALRDS